MLIQFLSLLKRKGIGMNIYKCTLLALLLSSQTIVASINSNDPIQQEEVETSTDITNEECVIVKEENSSDEEIKKTCKKGPRQEETEEESPFNPDYNSDPEEITPIGGVSGGTKRGLVNLIASLINNDEAQNSQKILSDYNIDNIHQGTKELVITIDDGPTPGVTDKILDSLAKHNAQAVFFVIGNKVKKYPSLMARIQREGHIVANHSMTHANLGNLSFWKRKKIVESEILGAHEVVKKYSTNSPYFYFRAPYGSWEDNAAKIINRSDVGKDYIGPLLWDIGGEMDTANYTKAADWACWSKKVTVANCLKGYKNETLRRKGGVVLFHDLNRKSAELIDGFLNEFASRSDYRFISIDELDLQ